MEDLRAGIWRWLAETEPGFKDLGAIEDIPDDGVRLCGACDLSGRYSSQTAGGSPVADDHLELIAVERTFGTEALASLSDCLAELAGTPAALMGSVDAAELNLTAGDVISIELEGGALDVELQLADHMAGGTLVIPRHKELDWQKMGTGRTLIRKDQVRKVWQAGGSQ